MAVPSPVVVEPAAELQRCCPWAVTDSINSLEDGFADSIHITAFFDAAVLHTVISAAIEC